MSLCNAQCDNLRSYRRGFDGKRIILRFNNQDKLATCSERPEMTINVRGLPVCWKPEEE